MSQHPEVLWAQRSSLTVEEKNVLYLTVNLPDIQEQTLSYELTPTSISFQAKSGNAARGLAEKDFSFKLEFYADVVPDLSTKKLSSRSFYIVIRKKDQKEEYWPRLTKEKVKNAFLKTDFSKWVDEDEQDGEVVVPEEGPDDMMPGGMSGMGGMSPGAMGGMGGMGGMDFEKMMAQMGGGAGAPDFGGPPEGADDDDSDDDGPPPLEEAESTK